MAGYHTFEGYIEIVTGAAIRFKGVYWGDDASPGLWFPLSQVDIIPDNDDTGAVVMRVKDWLAKKRGLFEFTAYTNDEIASMSEQ